MRPPQDGHGGRWSVGAVAVALVVGSGSVWRLGGGEQLPDTGDVGPAGGAREEPVVADAMEALGQDMEQEAADELVRRERHGLVAIAPFEAIVLPCEGDALVVGRDQAAVGDRDAVGVAREIGEHCLGPGEGRLGVDEPVLLTEWCELRGKGLGVAQAGVFAEERQPADRVAASSLSSTSLRKSFESTRTGRKKPGLHATHLDPSSAIPPPGTIMWTCG
jgi:hypothetical protein